MKCPHCGKEVPKGKKFCGFCGEPIVKIEEDVRTIPVGAESRKTIKIFREEDIKLEKKQRTKKKKTFTERVIRFINSKKILVAIGILSSFLIPGLLWEMIRVPFLNYLAVLGVSYNFRKIFYHLLYLIVGAGISLSLSLIEIEFRKFKNILFLGLSLYLSWIMNAYFPQRESWHLIKYGRIYQSLIFGSVIFIVLMKKYKDNTKMTDWVLLVFAWGFGEFLMYELNLDFLGALFEFTIIPSIVSIYIITKINNLSHSEKEISL
jgi:hypothetical protein